MNLVSKTGIALFALIMQIAPLFAAEPIRHHMEYQVRLSGFALANASFDTEIHPNDATITGKFVSIGLANLFTGAEGENVVKGKIANNRFWPETYKSVYQSGKDKTVTEISFDKGKVTGSSVNPPRKDFPENWIKITPEDLKAVTDPVSGLIISAKSNVCPTRIQVYDGEIRMDLKLVPKGQKHFKTTGFDGMVEVCGVEFSPKAGYRADRDDLIELSKSKRIEVWFARADKVDAYAPVYIQIPVRYGQFTVTATKFGS